MHDLIPRLSSAVSSLMKHEQSIQDKDSNSQKRGANEEAAERLLLLIENYPELKFMMPYPDFKENYRIPEIGSNSTRAYYNNIATFYNTRLERIPTI